MEAATAVTVGTTPVDQIREIQLCRSLLLVLLRNVLSHLLRLTRVSCLLLLSSVVLQRRPLYPRKTRVHAVITSQASSSGQLCFVAAAARSLTLPRHNSSLASGLEISGRED